ALQQDQPAERVIVVDGRGRDARPDFVPPEVDSARLRHLPGVYANRAAMCNAALEAAEGDFMLLALSDAAEIRLRRSAARTMLMAAVRQGGDGSAPRRPVGL